MRGVWRTERREGGGEKTGLQAAQYEVPVGSCEGEPSRAGKKKGLG